MLRRSWPFLIVLAGFALRMCRLDARSLWIDEGFTAYLAGRPLDEAVIGAALDVHPPLHFVLMHLWELAAGSSGFALRFSSVLAGTASIAALHGFVRHLGGEDVALVASAALAASPMHVWYSQEARMYALLALLAIVSSYLLVRQLEHPTAARWAFYVVTAIAALYTQYYALFLLAGHAVVWLAAGRRHGRTAWAAGLGTQAAAGLAFAPWVPVFRDQTLGHRMTWLPEPSADNAPSVVAELVLGLRGLTADRLGVVVVAAALALVVVGVLRARGDRRWLVTSVWLLVPVVGSVGVSLFLTPILHSKQLVMVLPAFLAIAALAAAPLARSVGGVPVALLAVLAALPGLQQDYFVYTKQDWRGLVGYIAAHRQPGDVVFLNPGPSSSALDYYLGQLHVADLPRDGYPAVYEPRRGNWSGQPATPAVVDAKVDELARSYRRVWLVQFSAAFWDPGLLIQKDMRERFVERPMPGFTELGTTLYETGK